MNAFLKRPIEGDWPYVWLDATYVKVRRNHHIVSVAVIIAVGVNTDGRRELGFNRLSQQLRGLIEGTRQTPRPVSSSRVSCAVWC